MCWGAEPEARLLLLPVLRDGGQGNLLCFDELLLAADFRPLLLHRFFACSMALSGVIGVASGSLLLLLAAVALAFAAMPTMAGVADPLDTEPTKPSDS